MTRNIALDRQYEAAEVVFCVDKILPSLLHEQRPYAKCVDQVEYFTTINAISAAINYTFLPRSNRAAF